MTDWIDATFVADNADVDGAPATSVPLINATAAAVAYVQRVRADLPWNSQGWSAPADVKLGTAMLAWRLYERRNSPLGITTTATGDMVSILRDDPDISRLLGVGAAQTGGGATALWSNEDCT